MTPEVHTTNSRGRLVVRRHRMITGTIGVNVGAKTTNDDVKQPQDSTGTQRVTMSHNTKQYNLHTHSKRRPKYMCAKTKRRCVVKGFRRPEWPHAALCDGFDDECAIRSGSMALR